MWSAFFFILSYLDRNFVRADTPGSPEPEKASRELFYMLNNTLCARSSVAGQHLLHQVTDGVEEVRSVHNSDGRLVDCSIIRNDMQVKSFMHVCRLGLRDQKTGTDLMPSPTGVSEARENCDRLKSKGDSRTPRRAKRGFTYPGTLWCGAGNIADGYDQLGEFAETDMCCRVHDHCPYVIHAFSSKYGYTNFKWHSLSHCDCDNALKECLRQVNDTSSRVVGQAFFNVIEAPCFEFSYEEQCVERHWYGVCKRYDKVPVAVIRESIPYDFGGIDVIDVLPIGPTEVEGSDKEKQDESQNTESTTQSTLSESKTAIPEEPSLTNVVTAAEDFIKVLATVSTSQSSSTDAGKGETQSEKKKKHSGKKKKDNKKRKGKGKGRKKGRKLDALKIDEGTSSTPSTGQTEELMGKNNLMEGHTKIEMFRAKDDNFMNSELDAVGNGAISNKMMRDDPRRTINESREVVYRSENTKEEIQEHARENKTVSLSTTSHIAQTTRATPVIPKMRREKKNRRKTIAAKQSHLKEETLSASPDEGVSLPTSITESPIITGRKEEERGPVVAILPTQNTPIVRTERPKHRARGRKRIKKIFTEDPTSGDSQPVEEALLLEKLGLDGLENLERFATSSDVPVGTKNSQHILKGTVVRRKLRKELSRDRRVIKICYEVVLPADTDATVLPPAIQTMDPELSTTPALTLPPSTGTHTPKPTKMKRTKERGSRMKKRRS